MDVQPAVQRADPAAQAGQAAARRIRAADAVVLNPDDEDGAVGTDAHEDLRGGRVFGRVRHGLRHDEVGGRLDGGRQRVGEGEVHPDGDAAPLGHPGERLLEPQVVECRRIDPPGHLPQLGHHFLRLMVGLLQQALRLFGRTASAGASEEHGQRHQSLLYPVVQVSLDAPAFGVDGLQHRRPAGGQFVDALLHQLAFRGAEVLAGQPRVERLQRHQALDVQEEQYPAEQALGEHLPPAERGAQEARDEQPRQEDAEGEQADHDAGDQTGVGAAGEVAQDLVVGDGAVGEAVPVEDRAAPALEPGQPTGSGDQDCEGVSPGARPQQERAQEGADHREVEQSQQCGRAADQEARGPSC